ncbi:flagellar export protein FliJ [Geotalea uraniireducens]|uniref:Flagellar FliJ protein n=1 Tax=Geotalea uraniireducens TaxID=351604 RepID=A0ABN6VQ84_9BACT|nr:flagellar export protein FliJ [Geotalea uraniireducens]BDV41452.1 flagellar export protein FliJ [Geotalea uraniireducens]
MMHKQGFQLQQVLNYRKEVEKARKLEFVTAKREFENASELLQRHEAEADRARVEFNNRQATGISVNELQMYSNFFSKKTCDIQQQRCQVSSLGQELTEKREVLLDAAKEKKSLELLKEKQLMALRRELAEKERNFLDELSVQRAVR